jgi:hypothetical protein
MSSLRSKQGLTLLAVFLGILGLTAGVELALGRSFLGPDGHFGWWEGDIWSSENSQRLADPYSFSHIIHGFLFYGILRLATPKWPIHCRLCVALGLEAGWEILENSPLIIDRYRAVTIALGYVGDSVMNSLSDIVMMAGGFLFAWRARAWVTVVLAIVMELGCLFWVRDNLTLNIVMLVHPIDAIKTWQMGAAN